MTTDSTSNPANDERPVLLVAYSCEPGRGGEPGIGWNAAIETARHRPVWLIVHPDHRGPLDQGIAEHNRRGEGFPIAVRYVAARPMCRAIGRLGYFGVNVCYYGWIREVGREAVRLHREVGGFALAQHVSLCRWWMPTPAMALAEHGVPFLWGPVAAGETLPRGYRRGIGLKNHLTELGRRVARGVFSLDPALARCARDAHAGIAEPEETAERLRGLGCRVVERAATRPADPAMMEAVVPMPKPAGTFRIVSGGGLSYWRGVDQAVRAFAEAFAQDPSVEYVHVCDGEFADRVRREAERLGVAARVTLTGDMPHVDTLRWVASADVYCLPTLRDTGGHLFEALSAGVPCVVSDHLTPRAVVDETCGLRVPVGEEPATFVRGLADAMRRLRQDDALRARLSKAARVRAGQLDRQHWGDRLRSLQARAIADAVAVPSRQIRPSRSAVVRAAAAV